jgi:hypothetical protein
MKYEKPQKGNPHNLTIKQHVFPRASIERFYDSNGFVSVFSKSQGKVIPLRSSNEFFCAKRVWDQRTEAFIGKQIEDEFQALVRGIESGAVTVIGHFQKRVVEEFYSLWRTRHRFLMHGLDDISVNGIAGEFLTVDQQELLEKHHTIFFRDGVMPGRFAAGIHVMRYMDSFLQSNMNMQWGIIRTVDGEFIVPDCFEDMMIIPLAPTVALMADQPNSIITRDEVAVVNRVAISRSSNYFFARDLSSCPVISYAPPRLQRLFSPDSTQQP